MISGREGSGRGELKVPKVVVLLLVNHQWTEVCLGLALRLGLALHAVPRLRRAVGPARRLL